MAANTALATVVDPHKHRERFMLWDGALPGVSEGDAQLIRSYINDMRDGINVNGKRGKRSPIRLNTIRSRMAVLSRQIATHTGKTLTTVSEEELTRMFARMRDGTIKRDDGKPYKSVADYVISFKAFWHWHIKRSRKQGSTVTDITLDLDTSQEKPKFHYLTKEQVKKLADNAKPYYRALMWFLFDAGIRAPTETMNVRVSDLTKLADGIFQLEIREETSKTFGRKIKLLLCSEIIEQHIQNNNLGPNDFLFTQSPGKTNEYLGRLGYTVLGIGTPRVKKDTWMAESNGEKVQIQKNKTVVKDGLTMYDFRHCAACHWLPKYKSESALKYRFGWKNSDMIHYYTEFLGMKDTITQDDLIDSEEKTRLQKQLEQQAQQLAIMQEQLQQNEAMVNAVVQAKLKELFSEFQAKK